MDLSKLQETVEDRRAWGAAVHERAGHNLATERQQQMIQQSHSWAWSGENQNSKRHDLASEQQQYFIIELAC